MSKALRLIAAALILAALGAPAQARPLDRHRPHIDAAAARFDLPAELIEAVIRVESNGQPRAVSRAGAMGLMQLMPGTWAMLRDRLNLGGDPFDPRDNILAGAAYLRDLRDRYGAPGFLAAYNAGPGRYEESLAGRALPSETRQYVDRLSGGIDVPLRRAAWPDAGLFPKPWPQGVGPTASPAIGGAPQPSELFAVRARVKP